MAETPNTPMPDQEPDPSSYSGGTVKRWLRDNGYPYLAKEIDDIETEWRSTGKATRRNWWDVLAGDKRGRPRQVAGRTFPVLPEAVERRDGLRASGHAAVPPVRPSDDVVLDQDAKRLIEGAVRALELASSALGSTVHGTRDREENGQWAIELGLIGIAAELAMSAILVQARGIEALCESAGRFKTFGAVREELDTALSKQTPEFRFLLHGEHVGDVAGHQAKLTEFIKWSAFLVPLRAAGVHAAQGLTHETTSMVASRVADFLEAAGVCDVFHSLLRAVPRCLTYPRDRSLLIEDLARRLAASPTAEPQALASLFLVLPSVPAEAPEWLEAFERVTVAPKEQDVVYLLEVLRTAAPVVLQRVRTGGGELTRVLVRPDDPFALPIAPQYLRSEFKTFRDQFYAERGLANSRLNEGVLDLPNADVIRVLFARGLDECGVLAPERQLSGHDAWPFVASSLMVQGTPGPFWFLIRRTGDLGQLAALLRQAAALAPARSRLAVDECLRGIEAIRSRKSLPANDSLVETMNAARNAARLSFQKLAAKRDSNLRTARAWPASLSEQFENVVRSGVGIGDLLDGALAAGISVDAKRYWCRVLAESTGRREDAPALVRVLEAGTVAPAHTAARKALRLADFDGFGPSRED